MITVGERALAVFPAGDLYHSQWGGDDEVLAQVLGSRSLAAQFRSLLAKQWHPREPLSAPLPDAVDYLELAAVYVLSSSGVRVYLPLWFGLPLLAEPSNIPGEESSSPSLGALVPVDSMDAVSRFRRQFRRGRAELSDGIAAGLFCEKRASWTLLHSLPGYVHPSRTLLERTNSL